MYSLIMNYRTLPIIQAKVAAESLRSDPPINVFKQLRLDHGFTQRDLQERIYISKQSLIRLEQGTYETPLPAVLEWWASHVCGAPNCPANRGINPGHPIGELRLRDAYSEFQELTRQRYTELFGKSLCFNDQEYGNIKSGALHPFRALRSRANYNVTETAKALCVPQATIEHFEKKAKTQQTVPKNIKSALFQMGYKSVDVVALVDAYAEYRSAIKHAYKS